jgi:putative ABC transport system substrate-binding protein
VRRREFIAGVTGAVAWPLVARGQQPGKIYRIGFIGNDPTIPTQPVWSAFLDGLRENGFSEGKNIIIERRFAEGRHERYADLANELVNLRIDIIASSSSDATVAVKRATNTIPVVMLNVNDPVGQGIIASLAHPGGNITGVTGDQTAETAAKRLQLLKDAVPYAARVAVLMNPDNPDVGYVRTELDHLDLAAPALNLKLQPVVARQTSEFEGVFAGLQQDRPDAMFVANSSLNFANRRLIMDLALRARLPTVSDFRESTEAGGLLSYNTSRVERFRLAAILVGKILKGAKPSELPVEQPTKYELVINLKTAKALNLEIPRSLQLLADEVIE